MTGSLLSYWLGAVGGKPLLLRWGKYVFLKPADIEKTEQFFARHGAWTVLIARFLPVVRHLISIPAGIARMRMPLFMLQTFIGSALWGGGLMVLGYQIGANWESVAKKAKRVDLIIAALVVIVLVAPVRFCSSGARPRGAAAAAAGDRRLPLPHLGRPTATRLARGPDRAPRHHPERW
jgi:membrane protein DedA with SNARE-associated domain